jgi:hypothetical protein
MPLATQALSCLKKDYKTAKESTASEKSEKKMLKRKYLAGKGFADLDTDGCGKLDKDMVMMQLASKEFPDMGKSQQEAAFTNMAGGRSSATEVTLEAYVAWWETEARRPDPVPPDELRLEPEPEPEEEGALEPGMHRVDSQPVQLGDDVTRFGLPFVGVAGTCIMERITRPNIAPEPEPDQRWSSEWDEQRVLHARGILSRERIPLASRFCPATENLRGGAKYSCSAGLTPHLSGRS